MGTVRTQRSGGGSGSLGASWSPGTAGRLDQGETPAAWPWLGRVHSQVKTIEGFPGELLSAEAKMGKSEPCCRWTAVWAVRWGRKGLPFGVTSDCSDSCTTLKAVPFLSRGIVGRELSPS